MKTVAYIFTKGDPSVGIGGQNAEVIFDGEFEKDEREDVRDQLGMCFSSIWDEKATVIFADETTGNDLEDMG